MKIFKKILFGMLAISAFASCTKVTNDDISFVKTGIAPSNLAINIAISKAGIATITPTANGVAIFDVNFGDRTANEMITPGKSAIHEYTEGSYTVKVVAKNLSGDSIVLSRAITVVTSELLVDFEVPATTYNAGPFGGAAFAKIANPFASGINTSANVGRFIKGSSGGLSETWAGMTINTTSPFTFASKGIVKMKVYANRAGVVYLFKLEAPSSGVTVETSVVGTVANAWEELTFKMDPSVNGRSFGGFSFFYDFGARGNGSANFIGYFDDIKIFP